MLKRFIELAEEKVKSAQAKADEVQEGIEGAAGSTGVDDLEASETPESILLSTVSGEQSRDRTDRAIVTPWLKFLWETYRTVLDILRNNARLEIMYQSTAMQAFEFCQKYARKTEFRRLCELLRNHVQTAAKYSTQMHAINLNDPDTLQRHLETRFQQLNVAVELELWQEAFRSVEDIHTLLNLSKRPPKNVMMANYYEKLTRIFLVGENYLFHAAAWSRYYNLLRHSAYIVSQGGKKADNPAASEADLTNAASFVLLSALAIPVISTSRSRGALVDIDEAKKNKNSRLTHLLGMTQAPTRAVLFKDAMSKDLLSKVRPEIRDLYNILEVDFHPLSICQKISPILSQIGADAEMEKYVLPLQQVILTRLFQQLSQVYESVDLAFVENLAQFPAPFEVSKGTIEKFIMNGNKKGDLAIRMDHATGVLSFDTDVFSSSKAVHSGSGAGSAEAESMSVQKLQSTPSEIVRAQLSRVAKALHITCQYVDPSFNQQRVSNQQAAFARAKAGAEQEHRETLLRKEKIQKRKEEAAERLSRKEKEDALEKRRRAAELQELEDQRLQKEQKEREAKRVKAELDKVRREEIKKQIAELKIGPKAGLDFDEEDLENLDSNRLRAMKLAQLEREKNDTNEKLRITGKRIDHLERAFRKEEAKKLPEDYEKQKQADLAAYEKTKAQVLKDAEAKHAEDLELSKRLSRLLTVYEAFQKDVASSRREEFEKRRRDAEKELEKQKNLRIKEHRERKIRERREREEQERLLREEEERAAKEAEEKAANEERRRAQYAEHKAAREAERQEAMEKAALQERRAEEALARKKAAAASGSRAPFMDRADSNPRESRAPPLIAGAKGTWREKEAARAAAGADAAPARTESPANASTSERPRLNLAPRSGVDRTDSSERPSGRPSLNLAPRSVADRTDSSERPSAAGRPALNLAPRAGGEAGSKPTWREREAARLASGEAPPTREAPPSRVASGSVPYRARGDRDVEDSRASASSGETLKPTPGKWVPKSRQ